MPQINNVDECTLELCPIEYATVDYDPSLGGNVFYLAIFSFIFLLQALLLWRYKTWSFSLSMMSGLVLEIVGYVGRVQMHFNPFLPNPFLIYIICLTIGPVFFAAAIYLTLSRIIIHYGIEHARISPKTISITFISFDFTALVLQAIGGAIADTANTKALSDTGTHIMVAGLSFQVLTLLLFTAVALEFARNVRRSRRSGQGVDVSGEYKDINGKSERSFKRFLVALVFATLFVLIRSCFRVAELAKGFGGKLANEEVPFMILEGAMIVLATTTLTAFHPGYAFGPKWKNAGWNWKANRDAGTAGARNSEPESLK